MPLFITRRDNGSKDRERKEGERGEELAKRMMGWAGGESVGRGEGVDVI